MPWSDTDPDTLTLPPGAGPDGARLVMGPDLPSPLDTYTFPDGAKIQAAIVMYPGGTGNTYEFIGVANGTVTNDVRAVWGVVSGGSMVLNASTGSAAGVEQYVTSGGDHWIRIAGKNSVQIRAAGLIDLAGASAAFLNSDEVNVGAISGSLNLSATDDVNVTATDQVVLSSNSGNAKITVDGNGTSVIDGATANQIIWTVDNGTSLNKIVMDLSGVKISTADGSDDITLDSSDKVILTAVTAVEFGSSEITIDGDSAGRGVKTVADLTSTGSYVTAETAIKSFSHTFKSGRCYAVSMRGRTDADTAGADARMRVRTGSVTGTLQHDYGGVPCHNAGADYRVDMTCYLRRSGADTTQTLVFTMDGNSGGTRVVANSTSPWIFVVEDIGPASKFPNAKAV